MIDAEAYRLLHEDKHQANYDRGEFVTANAGEPGFDEFLKQLPSTIHGFRMEDKSWGMMPTQYEHNSSS
jgi:hypothetical protein